MRAGMIFEYLGEEFIFVEYKHNCVRALRHDDNKGFKPVRFNSKLTYDYLKTLTNGRYNLDAYRDYIDKKHSKINMATSMNKGDKFVAVNGKVYTFMEMKRTRFICVDDKDISYRAYPNFIDYVLEDSE